ncbi:MAG: methyltransferase domain-containing protein [Spirochaetota bacterium]
MVLKKIIARNFSRAAPDYDTATPVQQQSAEILFSLLQNSTVAKPRFLDIGVGCGRLFSLARRQFGAELQLHGIDFAPQMLEQTRKYFPESQLYFCDAENYNYPLDWYDWIVSNFALQWCEQPRLLLQRLYKALRPGGQVAVALPVRGSLSRLAAVVERLSGETLPLYPLPEAGEFADLAGEVPRPALKEQYFFASYPNAYAALAAIKRAGAHTTTQNVLSARAFRLLREHPQGFRLDYKVLFICAKKPVP